MRPFLLLTFVLAALAACDEEPVAPTEGPQIAITSPEDQSIRLEGELVPFSGLGAFGGSDLSDEIVWSSDVDGSIGSGANFHRLLSVGTHTISATIPPPDPGLSSGSSSITFTIEELGESAGLALTSITAGVNHSCGLDADGVAYCWGNNQYGQLGNSMHSPGVSRPVAVSGGHTFTDLSAGDHATCGVDTEGAGYCWGNTLGPESNSTPIPIASDHYFTNIDMSGLFPCDLRSNGFAYCSEFSWEDETVDLREVGAEYRFTALTVGYSHVCALDSEGMAYCWGRNEEGRLGDGTTSDRSSPVAVAGNYTFIAVSAGGAHTCAVASDGTMYCWGANDSGQLGNGSDEPSFIPVAVSGSHAFADVSAGVDHTCGLVEDGTAYCWGNNDDGSLGDGTTIGSRTPLPVHGGRSFVDIVAGGHQTCAVGSDGLGYCWGANHSGQLGRATEYDHGGPMKIASPHGTS